MKIKSTKMQRVLKEWMCPECETGQMIHYPRSDGKVIMKNRHTCNKCAHIVYKQGETYPRIDDEKIEVK